MEEVKFKNYAVILSGGSGTRLWPLSREALPKQYLSFVPSEKSFLELTLERSQTIATPKQHIVITTKGQEDICRSYLKKADYQGEILIEPASKNTAPAIAMVAYNLLQKDPDSYMTVLSADHYIQNVPLFERSIQKALSLAQKDYFVVLGIPPTNPATEFGYIELGEKIDGGYKVSNFREKPNYQTAEGFLKTGNYLWNAGMFIWKTKLFWEEFSRIQPEMTKKISQINSSNANEIYKSLENIPIDIAFVEKASSIACVKAEFDWNDIGSWSAIRDCFPKDVLGNSIHGNVHVIDVKNCVVHSSGPFVSVIGLENVGVIATKDAILVTNLSHAQQVKKVASAFEQQQETNFKVK